MGNPSSGTTFLKAVWLPAALCAAGLFAGCSDTPDNVDSKTTSAYAGKIKSQVDELIKTVGSDPKRAAEQGSVLLEELEVYESQPVGDHKETFAQLLQKCKDLVAAGNEGSSSKVTATLKEMKTLADKLPGK